MNNNNTLAYFAAGCFWGVEYYFKKQYGVVSVASGYMGGTKENPTYEDVCTGKTGHAETIEVIYDNELVSFETLARLFFEIHDFTQADGQGPDIGNQYRPVIFYLNEEQKNVSQKLIDTLKEKGHNVQTQIELASKFWKAEGYHQDYYFKKGANPYCHFKRKVF